MILQSRINALGRQSLISVESETDKGFPGRPSVPAPLSRQSLAEALANLASDWYCLECRRTVQLPADEEPYCPVCSSRLIPGPQKACNEPVAWVDGEFIWR